MQLTQFDTIIMKPFQQFFNEFFNETQEHASAALKSKFILYTPYLS